MKRFLLVAAAASMVSLAGARDGDTVITIPAFAGHFGGPLQPLIVLDNARTTDRGNFIVPAQATTTLNGRNNIGIGTRSRVFITGGPGTPGVPTSSDTVIIASEVPLRVFPDTGVSQNGGAGTQLPAVPFPAANAVPGAAINAVPQPPAPQTSIPGAFDQAGTDSTVGTAVPFPPPAVPPPVGATAPEFGVTFPFGVTGSGLTTGTGTPTTTGSGTAGTTASGVFGTSGTLGQPDNTGATAPSTVTANPTGVGTGNTTGGAGVGVPAGQPGLPAPNVGLSATVPPISGPDATSSGTGTGAGVVAPNTSVTTPGVGVVAPNTSVVAPAAGAGNVSGMGGAASGAGGTISGAGVGAGGGAAGGGGGR